MNGMNANVEAPWSATPVESLMQRPIAISGETPISEAIGLLQAPQSQCLLILDEKGRLCGVFQEEDFLNNVIGLGIEGDEPVKEFIDPEFFSLPIDSNVESVIDIMGQKGLRYIPLVDEDQVPKGLFSIRELINFISSQTSNDSGSFKALGENRDLGEAGGAIIEVLNLPITFALTRYGFNDAVLMRVGDPVEKAIQLFRGSSQIAALLFDQRELAGLFRLRDLPFAALHKDSKVGSTEVRSFMTPLPEDIKDHETIGNGIARMARCKVLFLHYRNAQNSHGLITGGGLLSYLYDHIHDDF